MAARSGFPTNQNHNLKGKKQMSSPEVLALRSQAKDLQRRADELEVTEQHGRFFKREEIKAMKPEEIQANMEAIHASMKIWSND